MAYTLGSKCAKNLCKRIVLLQLIIENIVTCFFWNSNNHNTANNNHLSVIPPGSRDYKFPNPESRD